MTVAAAANGEYQYTEDEEAILAIFREGDADGNGTLEEDEFAALMKAIDDSLSDADIEKMMDAADSNRDGKIQIEEFIQWVFGGYQGATGTVGETMDTLQQMAKEAATNNGLKISAKQQEILFSQAQKAPLVPGGKQWEADGFVSEMQMLHFLLKVVQIPDEFSADGFQSMWHEDVWPFVPVTPEGQEAKARRALEPDANLLDFAGFTFAIEPFVELIYDPDSPISRVPDN